MTERILDYKSILGNDLHICLILFAMNVIFNGLLIFEVNLLLHSVLLSSLESFLFLSLKLLVCNLLILLLCELLFLLSPLLISSG